MIDEAFLPFRQMVSQLLAFAGEIRDEDAGVQSHIYACEIASPVELNVVRNQSGGLEIGSVPPLYRVDTSLLPVFHHLRFTAEIHDDRVPDAE